MKFDGLPRDSLREIFSRVPASSIPAVEGVSPEWKTLTRSPSFLSAHLARSHSDACEAPTILILPYCIDKYHSVLLLLELLDGHPRITRISTNFLPENECFMVVGSCDGLLCLSSSRYNDPRIICNPILQIGFELPPITRRYCDPFDPCCDGSCEEIPEVCQVATGFGVDDVSGRYKVARMLYLKNHAGETGGQQPDDFVLQFDIFEFDGNGSPWGSGGSADWRSLGRIRFPLLSNPGVFVKGKLYWFTDFGTARELGCGLIASLDLHTETFSGVPAPAGFGYSKSVSCLKLGVLGGSLCLVDSSFQDRVEIWVMDQTGQSWRRQCVIRRRTLGSSAHFHFQVLCALRNGEILVISDGRLYTYNPQNETLKDLQAGFPWHFPFNAVMHVPSIISPERDGPGSSPADSTDKEELPGAAVRARVPMNTATIRQRTVY